MTRTSRPRGAALLFAGLAAAGAQGMERRKFSLAALRRDGVIIPFASFDGRVWSLHWPDSDVAVPLPISLADVPKKWWGPQGPDTPCTARLAEGETRPLKLAKPVHAKGFCSGHPPAAPYYRGGSLCPPQPTRATDGP